MPRSLGSDRARFVSVVYAVYRVCSDHANAYSLQQEHVELHRGVRWYRKIPFPPFSVRRQRSGEVCVRDGINQHYVQNPAESHWISLCQIQERSEEQRLTVPKTALPRATYYIRGTEREDQVQQTTTLEK